ncbi:hypothetical protein [Methylobacterium sp. NFXW15]|uniref:hypothetical protein n=1 Tax=Methylobacterium sp. NFXW15 TaxID=2819512 RepID=UPI003CF9DCB7
MPYDLTPEQLVVEREVRLGLHGHEFYTLLGYFTLNFCTCEAIITRLLSWVLDMQDENKFDLLVRGMDARTKCERLRQAAQVYSPMEAKLEARVLHYLTVVIPTRNKLMHSWPQMHGDSIYFTTVSLRAPGLEFLNPHTTRPLAPHIEINEFFRQGMWLGEFADDLLRASQNFTDHRHLGIIAPHSSLPQINQPKKKKATKR